MSQILPIYNNHNNTLEDDYTIYSMSESDDRLIKAAAIEYSQKSSDLTVIIFSNLYYHSDRKQYWIISCWVDKLKEFNDSNECPFHERCFAGINSDTIISAGRDAICNSWGTSIDLFTQIASENVHTKINIVNMWFDSYKTFV